MNKAHLRCLSEKIGVNFKGIPMGSALNLCTSVPSGLIGPVSFCLVVLRFTFLYSCALFL